VGLRWGLIPSWAKDRKIGYRLIYARAETVAAKPSFRAAFEQRRCLIAADAFYEWPHTLHGKQPYLIRVRGGEPFAFAGLWEAWHDKATGERVESCTIIVGAANDLVRPIHDRMPIIVPPADFAAWLDPAVHEPAALLPLLKPYPAEEMDACAISARVNKPANEGPELIERHWGQVLSRAPFGCKVLAWRDPCGSSLPARSTTSPPGEMGGSPSISRTGIARSGWRCSGRSAGASIGSSMLIARWGTTTIC
jgi:putative SOS response-associated peptidase YedK